MVEETASERMCFVCNTAVKYFGGQVVGRFKLYFSGTGRPGEVPCSSGTGGERERVPKPRFCHMTGLLHKERERERRVPKRIFYRMMTNAKHSLDEKDRVRER